MHEYLRDFTSETLDNISKTPFIRAKNDNH